MRDIREVEPGVFSVIDGDRCYEVRIDGKEARVNGQSFAIEWGDPREWNPRRARGGAAAGGQVKSPMPGKVVRILAVAGESVKAGQGIVVVEAMKMQNELKSPRDGVVKSIAVKEHDTVTAGAILATIE